MKTLCIARDRDREGPYSAAQISEQLQMGKLSMGDFAWHEGCAEWTRIHDMPEVVAAVLPPIPKAGTNFTQCAAASQVTHAAAGKPSPKKQSWWDRELWPGPTVAQLEQQVRLCNKLLLAGFVTALLLLGSGWLFEGKSKDEDIFGGQPQRYNRYQGVWKLASDGPLGFLGAMSVMVTIALGVWSHSLGSQLEHAKKKQSSPDRK